MFTLLLDEALKFYIYWIFIAILTYQSEYISQI